MSESVGNYSAATPTSNDMNSMLVAMRVFEELGSKKECQALLDNAPRLLYENTVTLRLHKKDANEKTCKVYIFDDYFLVASQRRLVKREGSAHERSAGMTTASSSESGVVWFGSNKQSDDGTSENSKLEAPQPVDYDSDVSYVEFEGQIAYEAEKEEIKQKKKYNLKMWVDLGKVKPRVTRLGDLYCVSIVYVSKVQEEVDAGVYRYNTVVDSAEIFIEDEVTAKTICGLIQEAVNKKSRDVLIRINKQRLAEEKQRQLSMKTDASLADTDTDTNSNGPQVEDLGSSGKKLSSKSSATSNSRRRRREKFRQGKLAYQATTAALAMTPEERAKAPNIALTMKDVQRRYRVFDETIQTDEEGRAEEDEGKEAEFVVQFKNSKLGLALSSGKNIEPFVCQLEPHGLAEQSGVQLADRVTVINDTEITVDHDYQDVIKILAQYKKEAREITITFRRKQKAEIARLKKEEAEKEALAEQLLLEEEQKAVKEAERDGAVKPVDDAQMIGKSEIRREDSIEFRRKTDDGSKIPAFTLKRKSKRKKNWKRKKEILDNMKHVNLGVKEFKEFKKNKKRMFELYEQIEDLFHTVLDYSVSKEEKSCIYALKEIYDTEYKYNADLNSLRGMHMSLLTAQKQVACKHVKSGSPFCEHRRPKRYCNQASSVRENAIDHKVVNSIFLNLKPIIKSNQYLWKSLQSKLGDLYKQAEKGQKIEVFDMLNVFCKVFIEIAPFLAIYWSYCQRYTDANENQRILRTENKYFRDVIRPIEKKVGTKLPNLMAKPVQRISRYHLLFEALKKQAGKYEQLQQSKGAPEGMLKSLKQSRKGLVEAYDKLLGLAKKVNSMVGEAAELDKILDIYQEIGGDEKVPNLIAPHRRFIEKRDISFEHPAQNLNEEMAILYLFNDKIVVAVARQMMQSATVKGGSKYSYPLRAIIKNSTGARTSSITKSRKKISMESAITEKPGKKSSRKSSKVKKKKSELRKQATLSKKLSMRLSNGRGNKSSVRLSTASKDSKGSKGEEIYYEVVFHIPMREVNTVTSTQKEVDGLDIPGIQIMYSKKHSEGSETTRFMFWMETPEEQKQLIATMEESFVKDRKKREELKQVRDKMLGKKKRKFARKRAQKKQSVRAVVKSKSSLFSTASHGARRAAAGIGTEKTV